MSSSPALFQPLKVGRYMLAQRVVMAPMTRLRVDADSVIGPLAPEYYAQRAHSTGTLLISEAAIISPKAGGGFAHVPGIWNEKQVAAWKKVADAVHAVGSHIFLQLGSTGRAADSANLAKDGFVVHGASPIPINGGTVPKEMTKVDISEYVQMYVDAALSAVDKAGFDGVEIHGANGYLLEQFLKDVTNQRKDEYGGSPDKRARFPLEVVQAVASAVGADRTGLRLSPWNRGGETESKDPLPTYERLLVLLKEHVPELAYIHVVEPRVDNTFDIDVVEGKLSAGMSNDSLRALWAPRPYISSGGYTRTSALEAGERGELVAFGRPFIANPDLIEKLKKDVPLVKGNRATYYVPGDFSPTGYTDYPVSEALKN